MGFFKRRRPIKSPPVEEKGAAYWAQQAEIERLREEQTRRKQAPENKRGVLDEVGKRHVLQSTSHATGGVMLVGVWYAALRQLDYLGADGFFRDEYVVAAHSWLLSAIVAYIHKRQSGNS
tara:strand:- start:1711 stop:2070 length:360 start_codon:yes stop_codon:yes gene_type:complete